MNEIREMSVSTAKQFIRAIRLSQNVFGEKIVINVLNHKECFASKSELKSDIKYGVNSLYKSTTGSFAGGQLAQYSYCLRSNPLGESSKLFINTKYFSSSKEFNDLICVAAEIACLLNKKLTNPQNTFEKIVLFNNWIKNYFEYENTHHEDDHKAIELLKKRRGVCQAIAALAVLVLSYMGLKVLYITGEGKGKGGWGLHAWNVVKIDGQWIHVDFTFSMKSPELSSTKDLSSERIFNQKHQWDKIEYCDASLENKWNNIFWYMDNDFSVEIKENDCFIDGVKIRFSSKLYCENNGRLYVDLASIIRLLGGAIEYIPKADSVNLCIFNRRYVIKGVKPYIHDGYFDEFILGIIGKNTLINNSHMVVSFG